MPGRELRVVTRVKKVGNSLAVFLPAADARAAGIEEGHLVEALVRPHAPEPLGLLRDIPYTPFRREDHWRERV